MKYLLFAGYEYYPSGGASDFVRTFDTEQEARAYQTEGNWAEIASFDITSGALTRIALRRSSLYRSSTNDQWVTL